MKYKWVNSSYSPSIVYFYLHTTPLLSVKYSGTIELYNLKLSPFPLSLIIQLIEFKPVTQVEATQTIDILFTGLLI